MNRELLKTAATLCREAAEKLRQIDSPEKQAKELSDTMVAKGLISNAERERFAVQIAANPEKLAQLKDSIQTLPNRIGAIGEVITKSASDSTVDPWETFVNS